MPAISATNNGDVQMADEQINKLIERTVAESMPSCG